MPEPLLSITDLVVEFKTEDGVVHAVDGVSYELFPGEILGIVGESGSGKSVSTMALLGLIPQPPGRIARGTAMFNGSDLLKLKKKDLMKVRGKEVAMIFQDPMTALNPVLTIGRQLTEVLETHLDMSPTAARARAAVLTALTRAPSNIGKVTREISQRSISNNTRALAALLFRARMVLKPMDRPSSPPLSRSDRSSRPRCTFLSMRPST